ncbi:hypothetical protein ACPBXD_27195, partial [Escherichia coli]
APFSPSPFQGEGRGEGSFSHRCWPVPLTLTLSPNGARGLTESFFDVVISLEAARWLYFYVKEM